MFTIVPPALTHTEISRPRDATELNNDNMIKLGDVHYHTEPNLSFFFDIDSINDDSSSCLQILLTLLTCSVMFSFWKVCIKCPSLCACKYPIFDDVRYDGSYGTAERHGMVETIGITLFSYL